MEIPNRKSCLCIILVNWNGSDDTLSCIETIYGSTFKAYSIIVVDNGSDELQIKKLINCDYDIEIIQTGANLGYTGGNNVGIEHALKKDFEYVLLLNNDTLVAPDALENMIYSVDSDSTIGILSPKIFFYPRKDLIWFAGATLNSMNLMGHLTGYQKEDNDIYNEPSEVDYVTGCAMLVRTQVFKDVGNLCDDYFCVCEDIDFCLHAKQQGYRIFYEPSSVIWHKESASSGGTDAPQYVYYQTRNYFLFHSRWAENPVQLIVSNIHYIVFAFKRALSFIINGNIRGVYGIGLGIRDAIFKNYGKQSYTVLKKQSDKPTGQL